MIVKPNFLDVGPENPSNTRKERKEYQRGVTQAAREKQTLENLNKGYDAASSPPRFFKGPGQYVDLDCNFDTGESNDNRYPDAANVFPCTVLGYNYQKLVSRMFSAVGMLFIEGQNVAKYFNPFFVPVRESDDSCNFFDSAADITKTYYSYRGYCACGTNYALSVLGIIRGVNEITAGKMLTSPLCENGNQNTWSSPNATIAAERCLIRQEWKDKICSLTTPTIVQTSVQPRNDKLNQKYQMSAVSGELISPEQHSIGDSFCDLGVCAVAPIGHDHTIANNKYRCIDKAKVVTSNQDGNLVYSRKTYRWLTKKAPKTR